jgi:hypothetical protein
MSEIWKDIKGYEGRYEISNLGNVRSIRLTKSVILKASDRGNGYLAVSLCMNNIKTTKNIHSLIAQAFIPNISNKREINHINGIKTDNRIENLEWCTSSENSKHAYQIGLQRPYISENNKIATRERCQKVSDWLNVNTNAVFRGNSLELIKAFPEQKLHQGHLSKVRCGKRKHHKGWIIK